MHIHKLFVLIIIIVATMRLAILYATIVYRIAGNIDVEFNLTVWQSPDQPSN